MIAGIGMDIVDIDRIQKACEKRETFPNRVLTEKEHLLYHKLSGKRQAEFLAGRFAAKEAFAKAMGTGIGEIGFLDIEILPGDRGQPKVSKSPFKGKVYVSITHTDSVAAAQIILEN